MNIKDVEVDLFRAVFGPLRDPDLNLVCQAVYPYLAASEDAISLFLSLSLSPHLIFRVS